MYPFSFGAALAAAYFLFAAGQQRRLAAAVAAVLWAAYAVWEWHIANGTLCDDKCNIRVDLLLFIPILWGATQTALRPPGRQTALNFGLVLISLALVAALSALDGYYRAAAIAGAGVLATAVAAYIWRTRRRQA